MQVVVTLLQRPWQTEQRHMLPPAYLFFSSRITTIDGIFSALIGLRGESSVFRVRC
jgi:hypothetical protein